MSVPIGKSFVVLGALGTGGLPPVGSAGIAVTQVAYGSTVANTIKGEAAFVYTEATDTLTVGVIAIAGQSGTGVIRLPAATTSAGGITMGTDATPANLYRSTTSTLKTDGSLVVAVDCYVQNIRSTGASLVFLSNSGTGTALTLDSSMNAQFAKLITSYNGIATVGNGVVTVQGAGRSTAQTTAVASVATYTVGAADASFGVSVNVLVTTSTAHTFGATVSYTDEGNIARTLTLNFSQLTGAFITTITNVTGAGPYEGVPLHIRCKASTAITVATTGTFTTVTYNVEGIITKVA